MHTYYTDWFTYQIENREPEDLPVRQSVESVSRCLKCGWPVDITKHGAQLHWWDRGTETTHVCKVPYHTMRRRREIAWERECEKARSQPSKFSLKVGKRRIDV